MQTDLQPRSLAVVVIKTLWHWEQNLDGMIPEISGTSLTLDWILCCDETTFLCLACSKGIHGFTCALIQHGVNMCEQLVSRAL